LKFKCVLAAICIIEILIVVSLISLHPKNEESKQVEVYVGIAFCGSTVDEAKLLINRVKNYTNLFVLLSGPVGFNETVMTEICEYAFDAGLHIIVFSGILIQEFSQQKIWSGVYRGLRWRRNVGATNSWECTIMMNPEAFSLIINGRPCYPNLT